MKQLLLISIVILVLFSCQKDLQPTSSDYIETVRRELKDSLSSSDFQALDFSGAARSRIDSVGLFFLRVPFKQKNGQEDFVFVKTNEKGNIEKGKIVHLQGTVSDETDGGLKVKSWNGAISLTSLDRKSVFQSPIENGYIMALHQKSRYRTALQAPPDNLMPEVIITYTIPSSDGVSWSSWFLLQSFASADVNGGSGGGGYYGGFSRGSTGGGGGGGYSGDGGGSSGGGSADPVILVDREMQDVNEPIDIEKFINCFNAIPDAGATCSIEILADIPVDNDPNKIFNFTSRSPGHTFLNIRKSNGSQSVSQNIGFYPQIGLKTLLTNAPIEGKFVDNQQHEFNCGFKIAITPGQLHSAIVEMQRDKNYKYDIDNYNCTDWALDVFNAAGGNLQVPLYDISGTYPSTGTRMPSSVYNKLQAMKNANDPRAGGITIGLVKGFAGNSTGPCN